MEEKIEKNLKEKLTLHRYNHTIGVKKAAVKLFEKYKNDLGSKDNENYEKNINLTLENVKIAALLHDVAKQLKPNEEEEYIKKYNIKFDNIEIKNNSLHHAKIGKIIAENEYSIKNIDILNAINYHTTGRVNMSLLEKIICLADYIEENRNYKNVDKIRLYSEESLEKALYYALNNTLSFLVNENNLIHEDTIKARNYLLEEIKGV